MIKFNRQKGFTVIEMIVLVGVIAMVAILSFINFRHSEKNRRVKLSADAITSAIRLTQNYTLSGKQIERNAMVISGTRCSGAGLNNAIKYYIVHLAENSNTVEIRAEDNCGAVVLIQSYPLTQFTLIPANGLAVDLGSGINNFSTIDIVFEPPFAVIKARTTTTDYFQQIVITIGDDTGAYSRTVTVDGISGKIE